MLAIGMPTVAAQDIASGPGQILSAFFGLDDSRRIRFRTLLACRGVNGGDGMPVIFSTEIDDSTLDPGDFRITTSSGQIKRPNCVTLRPADEKGEKRTVLVIGDIGSADDQPVSVEIVDELMSLDGGVDFNGATASVIPLEAGPTMVLAELVPGDDWNLGTPGQCPNEGVKAVLRVTWTGGITKPGGAEIDEREGALYRVTVRQADGTLAHVGLLAVANLNDNDNNHDLCLGTSLAPVSVYFPAGALTDPNEDLNPDTEVTVSAEQP